VALLLAPGFLEQIIRNTAHRPTEVSHNTVSVRREMREEGKLGSEQKHEVRDDALSLEIQGIEGLRNRRILSVQSTEVMRESGNAYAVESGKNSEQCTRESQGEPTLSGSS
jgi:hypothetical protein